MHCLRRGIVMRSGKMIDGHDLSYHYTIYDKDGRPEGNFAALDGVDLEVESGQFIAILGHNGSGKSTLARHLNALHSVPRTWAFRRKKSGRGLKMR